MIEKKFDITKYLDQELINFINQKEEERRKTLQFLIIITAIFITIIFLFLSMSESDDSLIILVSMVICLVICYSGIMKIFYEGFKENIIKNLIEALKINISYYPEKSLDEEDFIGCALFEEPDYFSANELYIGKIDKTEIKFGYVDAQVEEKDYANANGLSYDYDYNYVYDDDDYIYHPQNTWIRQHNKTVTIFNGYLYCVDFNKKISGITKLYPKSFINLSKGLLLENPEFMSSFIVKSTDEIEARYVLSLSMLERIMNLRKKYGNFSMSFKNDFLYLAYPSSNINLNFSLFKPILSEDNPLIGYLTILYLAMDLVKELDLNTRIWTKD